MTEEKDDKNFTNVPIPNTLAEKIKNRIKGTGFTSIASYITYILEEVMTDSEEEDKKFNEEDEKRVKDRLRLLGYID